MNQPKPTPETLDALQRETFVSQPTWTDPMCVFAPCRWSLLLGASLDHGLRNVRTD